YGHEERHNEPAELVVDMAAEDGRFSDQHAGDERPQHGMDADEMRDQRGKSHDHQNGRDHGKIALEIVIGPSYRQKNHAAADGETHDQKQCRTEERLADAEEINSASLRQAEGYRDDHPADRILAD